MERTLRIIASSLVLLCGALPARATDPATGVGAPLHQEPARAVASAQ